jgi:arylsulfatase A-like enzyme
VENPLCCPSRASFLTGNDSHTTGVYTNDAPDGGFAAFNDSATLATWLNDAGYDTFLAGKYLNHYWETNGSYVPPGWDGWRAFASTPEYFNYDISLDGTANQSYGASEADYSTDVITGYADTAIRQASPQDPLFLWVAPFAPHGPSTPAPRDVGTLSGLDPWRPPSYNERNVSDKPGYVQATPRLSTDAQAAIDAERQAQLETLGAVDDGVQTILSALRDTGRLSDTMIVFTSDNGFLWGEHRRDGKNVPYDESIRIPLVIRWDRVIGAASTDGRLVQNVDLAPTIVQAAGASASSFDGRTLMPLLTGGSPQWRTNMLIEHVTNEVPSYCADRTPKDILVHYATGEEEYYRLGANADPLEDINRISSTKFAPRISLLRDKLRQMCTPLPPGLPGF